MGGQKERHKFRLWWPGKEGTDYGFECCVLAMRTTNLALNAT